MSEKNRQAEARVIIKLTQEPGKQPQLNMEHPQDIHLAINILLEAMRILAFQNLARPKPSPIVKPTERDLNLVSKN